jgi:tetratricopeptide (TPR) repeat protein
MDSIHGLETIEVGGKDSEEPDKVSEDRGLKHQTSDEYISEDSKTNNDSMEESSAHMDTSIADDIDILEGEGAFLAGNASIYYLRGLHNHYQKNLEDAIVFFTKCLDIAVASGLLEYIVKSQVQLASVHLTRYQIDNLEEDYLFARRYSDNLIEIAREQEMNDLMIEALFLRAVLRRIARDLDGAKEDLRAAGKITKNEGYEGINIHIEQELEEVRRQAAATRRRRTQSAEDAALIAETLERVPSVFTRFQGLELSRPTRQIPVKLYRLVIMNLPAGLPVYIYDFEKSEEDNDMLVYGLLSALSTFASEAITGAGLIRSLMHEDRTVMMEHREEYMAALITSEESFKARQNLARFLREYLRLFSDDQKYGAPQSGNQKEEADELMGRIFSVRIK